MYGLQQPSSSSAAPPTEQKLPYAEPSTSWARPSSSSARETAAETSDTDDTDRDYYNEWTSALNGDDELLDEYEPEGDSAAVDDILSNYMYRRNIKCSEVSDPNRMSKSVIEYVNFKYIVSNFRTIGLHEEFDISYVIDAQNEFQSFEKWFVNNERLKEGKKFIRDLRLPLFCHLYLTVYLKDHHEELLKFLDAFKYLFKNSRGTGILQELINVSDVNKLSPRLSVFRKNKYVFSVSPEHLNILYGFFHKHNILKAVFQEWFDINYITDEDPMMTYETYYNKDASKSNNHTKPITSKPNKNPDGSNDVDDNLLKKKLNTSQNINSSKSHTDDIYHSGDQRSSTNIECISNSSHQKPHSSKNQPTNNEFTDKCENLQMVQCDDDNDTELEINKETQSQSASYDQESRYHKISKNERTQKKVKKETMGRRKSNIGSYGSSSSDYEGSSEESSSQDSSIDEEFEIRNYFKKRTKPIGNLSYKTSRLLNLPCKTKIKKKSIVEDAYLSTSRKIFLKNCNKLTCSLLTSDHKYIASGSLDSLIYLWERSSLPTELDVNNIELAKTVGIKTNFISSEQKNNFIEIFDKSTSTILRGHGGSIFDLAEIPSAKLLLSASNDKTFRVWDLKSKNCLEVYDDHEYKIWCIATCPNNLQIVTGSCEGLSCLWYLNYKRPLRVYSGHLDDVLVVKFHPNQVLLATGSSDKTVRVFEVVTGECQRLLLGHTDYVTCLEFHTEKPNVLASASGAGEIMVWDLPSGQVIWKLIVGNFRFSSLIWLTNDVLLSSLTNGTVLKCDINKDYTNSPKKVKGFTTEFERLMSLQIIDTIPYIIGIQGKMCESKPSTKHRKRGSQLTKNKLQQPQYQGGLSQSPKLPFPQPIIKNSNLMKPGSSSTGMTPTCDSQINPVKKKRKIISSDVNDDIQLLQKPYIKSKATPQRNIQSISSDQVLQQPQQNVQPKTINISQMTTKSQNQVTMNINTKQSKARNCRNSKTTKIDIKDQLLYQLQDSDEPNIMAQQQKSVHHVGSNIHIANPNHQQQQSLSSAQSCTRLSTKLNQKNNAVQELRSQHLVSGNIRLTSSNIQQQQSLLQIRPKIIKSSIGNVQQQLSTATSNIRLTNVNEARLLGNNVTSNNDRKTDMSTQQALSNPGLSSSTSVGGLIHIRQKKLATGKPILGKVLPKNYKQMRQSVMESLLQTNPEMFVGGQPVIGEITRNPSTNKQKLNVDLET